MIGERDYVALSLPGLPELRPVPSPRPAVPVRDGRYVPLLVDLGQLELPPAPTGHAAVCEGCRQIIREAESAFALLWLHPDGDPRCPFGGYATPAGWAA